MSHDEPMCMYCYAESVPNPKIDKDCEVYPSTQAELNGTHCDDQTCACPHIGFGCETHPFAKGVNAEYCKKHGVLTLMCARCGGLVAIIAVAERYALVPAPAGPFLLSPRGIWEDPRTIEK